MNEIEKIYFYIEKILECLEKIEKKAPAEQAQRDIIEIIKKDRIYQRLTPEQVQVMNFWNEHRYIKQNRNETRNKPTTLSQIKQNLSIVNKAIKLFGLKEISELINKYFNFCKESKHIWNGRNHGYKNVIGFLTKIVEWKTKGIPPFWIEQEEEIELVIIPAEIRKLCNSFSQIFYNKKENEYICRKYFKDFEFLHNFLLSLENKNKHLPYSYNDYMKMYFNSIKESFKEQVIFPSILRNKEVTEVIFQDYLQKKCPGVKT